MFQTVNTHVYTQRELKKRREIKACGALLVESYKHLQYIDGWIDGFI